VFARGVWRLGAAGCNISFASTFCIGSDDIA
jgi:hypothetical protein